MSQALSHTLSKKWLSREKLRRVCPDGTTQGGLALKRVVQASGALVLLLCTIDQCCVLCCIESSVITFPAVPQSCQPTMYTADASCYSFALLVFVALYYILPAVMFSCSSCFISLLQVSVAAFATNLEAPLQPPYHLTLSNSVMQIILSTIF